MKDTRNSMLCLKLSENGMTLVVSEAVGVKSQDVSTPSLI